jgi:hypothetical protein
MPTNIQMVTTLQNMIAAFGELEHSPGFQDIGRLEQCLADAFEGSQEAVHVLRGGLKASGVPHTSYAGSTWEGGIDYAGNPGIFELARGDDPSLNHPEGAHADFLTKAVEPYAEKVGLIVDEIFERAMGGR